MPGQATELLWYLVISAPGGQADARVQLKVNSG